MATLRLKLAVVATVLAGLFITDFASAQLSDDLVYGLQLYGVRWQKKYDPLSKGYQLNVSFNDPDTGLPYYNDTNFYMGFANLALGTEAPGTIRTSATYTKRLVPAVRFGLRSVDLAGNVSPLSYSFESFLGPEDFTVDGNILFDIDVYINKLGTYDITLQASNRTNVSTVSSPDGSGLPDFDYDIGPYNLKGNIYVDALAAITDPFFERFGTDNPFARIRSGLSGLNLNGSNIEDLIARLEAGQLLSDDELSKVVNNSILSTAIGREPSSDLFAGLMLPDGLLNPEPVGADQSARLAAMAIPEPGMLALLALAGAGFFLSPRRRRAR